MCDSCTEIRAGNSVDVIEIDAATNRGIDEIRELREAARYRPARDRFKIYILDEAHQITDAAFNALLKTLEEPPGHVVFMLATTQPEDIPQTIRSRCQHFSFRAVRFEEILGQLRDLAAREKIEADEDALALLAEAGDGSMRDALSILDQAIASCDGPPHGGSGAATGGRGAFRRAGRGDAGRGPGIEREPFCGWWTDCSPRDRIPRISRGRWCDFCATQSWPRLPAAESSLLQISSDERQRVARVAELFSEEDLSRHLQIMLRTHGEMGYRQEQRFHLELGLLKMVHAQRLLPIEQLLSEAAGSGGSAPRRQRATGGGSGDPEVGTAGARRTRCLRLRPIRRGRQDQSRKCRRRTRPGSGPRAVADMPPRVVMGAAAPANVPESRAEPQPAPTIAPDPGDKVDSLRDAVLNAFRPVNRCWLPCWKRASGGWKAMNWSSRWRPRPTVIDMSVGADAKRLTIAAASGVAGTSR